MSFEIKPPIVHDTEKLLTAIQAISSEHAPATQTVKGGELFESEVTEGVRTHFKPIPKTTYKPDYYSRPNMDNRGYQGRSLAPFYLEAALACRLARDRNQRRGCGSE